MPTHHDHQPAGKSANTRLPANWPKRVKSAVLHVISLAQYATAYTRCWAADSSNARVRLAVENERLNQVVLLLREELRLKDARMARIPPHRRPQYLPVERLAILAVRAARTWSLTQAADAFLVTPDTIASWLKRVDESGTNALVQMPQPVNKFPDFVRAMVQRLKTLCPSMGKKKIAETLCRAGLHLGVTTVGRILKENPPPATTVDTPSETGTDGNSVSEPTALPTDSKRVVTAKYRNHVWHVDLTAVPSASGFWTSWLPFALPQCWPFCWWVALVLDHYSRRCIGVAVFQAPPTSESVRAFLGRAIHDARQAPKYIICDKGAQFWCPGFKRWCTRRGIKPRFGAVGQHGGLAVIERFILTVKLALGALTILPLRHDAFRREVIATIDWYNEHRPHMALGGRTPDEVHFARYPENRKPRWEPRSQWPRGASCARPWALVKAKPGARVELVVEFAQGRKHLPIVSLKRVA